VGRGEMPTEHGDSWFSPKCIEVQPRVDDAGGRALDGEGAKCWLPTPTKLRMPAPRERASETAGAKLRRREGNSPDPQLRTLTTAQCERGSLRHNSQDVGLEAAIIERVRNSSLVECRGTENVSRLKLLSEARNTSLRWDVW
jgi:hypothetical protein